MHFEDFCITLTCILHICNTDLFFYQHVAHSLQTLTTRHWSEPKLLIWRVITLALLLVAALGTSMINPGCPRMDWLCMNKNCLYEHFILFILCLYEFWYSRAFLYFLLSHSSLLELKWLHVIRKVLCVLHCCEDSMNAVLSINALQDAVIASSV